VGRELLGEGAALEAEATKLDELRQSAELAAEPLPRRAPAPPPPQPVFPPYPPQLRVDPPEWGIEPPEALDGFYRKLALVDLGVPGAIARAGHWGDSVLGLDGITSTIRTRLQSRFGDAGHGFHLMDRYHPSYRQQGVQFLPVSRWSRCLIVFECNKKDHRYGYGGLLAESSGGSEGRWATMDEGFGQSVSRFEVWFARREHGGNFEIRIDDEQKVTVSTEGPHLQDAWHEIRVEPGSHSFTVRAVGGGIVRAYGVVLENDGPGVVWDGMSLIAGSTRSMRTQDPEHIASQIRHRDLDLVVFLFGGNDMERKYVDLRDSMQPYYDEYSDALRLYRAGKPGLSCLVMSVLDHGVRTPDGHIKSRSFAQELSRAQREIARRNGCGFFDTYEATGGSGMAARWLRSGLMAADLGHPTSWGHQVIGGLVANAILYGYEQYRARMVGAPLRELARSSVERSPEGEGHPEGTAAPNGATLPSPVRKLRQATDSGQSKSSPGR
jgi:lysophospholipase L1-like esterase